MDSTTHHSDAHPPAEIARKVEHLGVAKAKTDAITLLLGAVYWVAYLRHPRT